MKINKFQVFCKKGNKIELLKNFFNGLRPNGRSWENEKSENLEI